MKEDLTFHSLKMAYMYIMSIDVNKIDVVEEFEKEIYLKSFAEMKNMITAFENKVGKG